MSDEPLDACHCCDTPTAEPIDNRPGLPAIAYRVGTWATFLDAMQAALTTQPALTALTTRAPDDPAMALLDAWAVVGDILTFYQERIANEAYLRTATETRSVQELARAIGYELGPGVAASTYLAFTVEQPLVPKAGLPIPSTITIATGTRVQSVPQGNVLPQTFETTDDIEARAAWNQMVPKTTQRQRLQIDMSGKIPALQWIDPTGAAMLAESIYLAGTGTNLRVGDVILVTVGTANYQKGDTHLPLTGQLCLYVTAVVPDYTAKVTRIDLSQDGVDPPAFTLSPAQPAGVVDLTPTPFTPHNVRAKIVEQDWTEDNLSAYLAVQGWDPDRTAEHVAGLLAADPPPAAVYAFRARSGVFGHSSPAYAGLKRAYSSGSPSTPPWDNWDDPEVTIWEDSSSTAYSSHHDADMFFERVMQGVAKRGWIALVRSKNQKTSALPTPFQIDKVSESSLADFSISGKATGVALIDPTQSKFDPTNYPQFLLRKTSVFSQSESLDVAAVPLVEQISNTAAIATITLDRLVLGLTNGQTISWTGMTLDPETQLPSGSTSSEILTVNDVTHSRGYTTIVFNEQLLNSYVRNTVVLGGNVAPASHGATTSNELLGSGNSSQIRQTFALKTSPLTYISAPTPSGGQSTLVVRVAGVQWNEVPSLYPAGPTDKVFISRQQPDGSTQISFGDGLRGARVPTGRNNLTATYRVGTGILGDVGAGKIALLQSKPLGVKSAVNPLAATGAADPEVLSSARVNAPRTVRTLDRLVSLSDYEDFTRGFAGIGKVQATPIWTGQQQCVHLTLGDAISAPIDPESLVCTNLLAAIADASDGAHQVIAAGYQARFFKLVLQVVVDPAYVIKKVTKDVTAAIKAAYVYAMRDLGQWVTDSEIIQIVQARPGVIATEISALYDAAGPPPVPPVGLLQSMGAHFDGTTVVPADLLLLHPVGLTVTGTY
jgi:hypothetical protein